MTICRIALANVRYPASPDESVAIVVQAISDAGGRAADIVCFGECYVPGYRSADRRVPPPNAAFLEAAWATIAAAAKQADVAVVLGTERVVDGLPVATALVIERDGTIAGFQDKVQLDPTED